MAQQYRSKKKNEPQIEQVLIEGFFKGIVAIFRALFGKKPKGLSSQIAREIADYWVVIEDHLSHEARLSLAVSEADKLLDTTFQHLELAGSTMGERLRSAETKLGAALYQEVWEAHKLRNALAHEVGARVSQAEASHAVTTFKKALRQLGVPV